MQNQPTQRKRHVPQGKGASHIYWSHRADGTKVFEVRHPRNAEGKRLYETVGPNLAEAKARAREVHGDSSPRVASVGLTLSAVVDSWKQVRQVRPRTVENYDRNLRLYILPRFGNKKVKDIDRNAITAWLVSLNGARGPLSESSKSLILAVLDVVLNHAVDVGAIGINPVRQIKRGQRPKKPVSRRRVLTHEEEARLLAYCAPFPWLREIIIVALHQALRLGEVAALRFEDIDFAHNKLHVRHSLNSDKTLGPTKGGKAQTIELTPVAHQTLLELRLDSAEGFVFRNRAGEPKCLRDIQRALEKARERAALPVTEDGKVVFHSLRHTGISRLANHPSIPLVHVRDFARHFDLATTQGYVHKIEDKTITAAIGAALSGENA